MHIRFHYKRIRALLGDLEACHDVGATYATGDPEVGVAQHQPKAAWWYHRAARRGHPESQYDLGFMLLLGEGTAPNSAEALSLLERSAGAGYPEALRLLADVFAQGLYGVPLDEGRALKWREALSAHLGSHPEDRRHHELP